MIRLTILATVLGVGLWVAPGNDIEYSQPIPIPTTSRPATTTTTPTTTTAPVVHTTTAEVIRVTTTTVAWPDGLCAEWYVTANAVGWPLDLLPVIGEIMWRESRCLPDVTGTGAHGLTQIQWSAHSHWIDDLGFARNDLFNPAINLAVAWELFQRADNDPTFRCGLSPWYMSTPPDITHWCQRIGQ